MIPARPLFIRRLLRYWDEKGVPYLEGVDEPVIRDFERRRHIELPEDMRAFYLATNGLRVAGSDEADDRGFDFWPLESLYQEDGAPSKLVFADVMQSAWQFATEVSRESESRGAVYVNMASDPKVAASFGEFIELYIANDERLYPRFWYHGEESREQS